LMIKPFFALSISFEWLHGKYSVAILMYILIHTVLLNTSYRRFTSPLVRAIMVPDVSIFKNTDFCKWDKRYCFNFRVRLLHLAFVLKPRTPFFYAELYTWTWHW
jgi:hypothetical protein